MSTVCKQKTTSILNLFLAKEKTQVGYGKHCLNSVVLTVLFWASTVRCIFDQRDASKKKNVAMKSNLFEFTVIVWDDRKSGGRRIRGVADQVVCAYFSNFGNLGNFGNS